VAINGCWLGGASPSPVAVDQWQTGGTPVAVDQWLTEVVYLSSGC